MAVIEKGGYDCEFVPELPEDYNCVICQCALRSPKQIENCGHRFCACCFTELKNWNKSGNSIQCPIDRQEFDCHQVFSDKATERLILNWKIKCPNHEMGCEWIGELNTVKEHTKTCQNRPNESKNEDLQEKVALLEKKVLQKTAEIERCKDELLVYKDEIKFLKKERASELNQYRNELEACKDEIKFLKNNKSAEVDRYKDEVLVYKDEIKFMRKQKSTEVDQYKKEFENSQVEINYLKNKNDVQLEELNAAKEEIEFLKNGITKLFAKIESQSAQLQGQENQTRKDLLNQFLLFRFIPNHCNDF